MRVLALNSGSSSQKCCLYEIDDPLPVDPPSPLWEGRIQWDGDDAVALVKNARGISRQARVRISSRAQATEHLLRAIWDGETRAVDAASDIDVVGHRVVHGGPQFEEPALITDEVKSAIDAASKLAPLHTAAELEGVRIVENLLGSIPQVAVFDTGFHRKMPLRAAVYPGPYEWFETGIHRYGFHGINHRYCATRAAQLLGRDLASLKIVTCHLGNGCSLAAISAGRSIETTMGFTPLEGLMMGTRSGSVDPGILTYLMRQGRLKPQDIDEMLNKKSGLLGISGISGDMREIQSAMKQGHQRARLAFEMFTHRLQAGIGAMVAVLGGVDALVFSAGIGEGSPEVRSAACGQLAFLGLELDEAANARVRADQDVATPDSRVRILVIGAQEDWAIAQECWKLVRPESRSLTA